MLTIKIVNGEKDIKLHRAGKSAFEKVILILEAGGTALHSEALECAKILAEISGPEPKPEPEPEQRSEWENEREMTTV